jgi:hypothetical protein
VGEARNDHLGPKTGVVNIIAYVLLQKKDYLSYPLYTEEAIEKGTKNPRYFSRKLKKEKCGNES